MVWSETPWPDTRRCPQQMNNLLLFFIKTQNDFDKTQITTNNVTKTTGTLK